MHLDLIDLQLTRFDMKRRIAPFDSLGERWLAVLSGWLAGWQLYTERIDYLMV